MNKTIEKAAREYAEAMCPIGDYCGGVYDEQRNSDLPIYTDDAKSVLEWFFTKPLSQRLTDEERERVRKEYAEAQSWLDEKPTLYGCNSHLRVCAVAIQSRLESIFGKQLFGEGEGC